MRTLKTSCLVFLVMLLITSVRSAIETAPENPYCPASGQLNLDISSLPEFAYDEYGYYFDQVAGNTADIFVTYGDPDAAGERDFTFTIFDDITGVPSSIGCQGTASMKFIALLQNALILKDEANSKYYTCIFYPQPETDELSIFQMHLPSPIITNANTFLPYYYDSKQNFMIVAVSNDTQGNILMYHSDFRVSSAVASAPNLDYQIQNAVGSYLCLLTTNNQVKALRCVSNEGAWQDRTLAHGITENSVVHFLSLSRSFYGILVLDENRLSGNFKIYVGNMPESLGNQDHELELKERPYQVQSDGIFNIVIYSNEFFYWFHLTPSPTAPPRSVKLQTDDIDTGDTMIAMALSSNKLTILYDGRVNYYTMMSGPSGPSIGLYFSKEFTTDIEAEGAYRFGLTCVCQTLKRFSCYSSTLNCLLIKKGSGVCGGRDLPPAPSVV